MKFVATMATADGRLTRGHVYFGNILYLPSGIRIVVFDNRREWMTFNPDAFRPVLS